MKALSQYCLILIGLMVSGCEPTGPEQDPIKEAYKHIRAGWSPDGQSIAFTGDVNGVFGIYAVDTSGANLRLIHEGDAVGLSWSPDGQSIVYSERTKLYIVSVLQDVPQLILSLASSIRPSWSPDGAQIAYVRNGIWSVTLATGLDRMIYPTGTSPSWRPDGNSVLISDARSDFATGGIAYSAFQVSADSLHRSDLYSFITFDDCAFFVLSPDGLHLLFSRKPVGGYAQIRKANLTTRTETGLTHDGGDYPAISPDGEWIVYSRTTEGDGGLWLMRMDGSDKRRLTTP